MAGLNVIAPGDTGYLWEAVRKSCSVEKEPGIIEHHEDRKYLKALVESYRNASIINQERELNKKRQHENTQLTHAKEYLRLFGGVYRRIPPKAQSKVPFRV